jgi:hypothetical protein
LTLTNIYISCGTVDTHSRTRVCSTMGVKKKPQMVRGRRHVRSLKKEREEIYNIHRYIHIYIYILRTSTMVFVFVSVRQRAPAVFAQPFAKLRSLVRTP